MDGHFLVVKRIILGIIILVVVFAVAYAIVSFSTAPKVSDKYAPKTEEQKLKILDDLARGTQTSATTSALDEAKKIKILDNLIAQPAQGVKVVPVAGTAPSQSLEDKLQQEDIQKKIMLLDSLRKKTE